MKKNIGTADKIIRLLLAALVVVLYFTGIITGTLGVVLLIVAGILVITVFTGFCGLYTLFGISTCPAKGKHS